MSNIIDESDIDELSLPITMPVPKKTRHYVDNNRLVEALAVWAEAKQKARTEGKEEPRMPEYVGACILDIATNQAKKHNFSGYSYKDIMIDNAVENVLIYIGNFNPTAPTKSGKPNAFGYISKMVYFSFTRTIQEEHREAYYKYKSYELMGGSAIFDGEGEEELMNIGVSDPHSIHNDFMSKIYEYESKMEAKKEASKKKENENEKDLDNTSLSLFDFMS